MRSYLQSSATIGPVGSVGAANSNPRPGSPLARWLLCAAILVAAPLGRASPAAFVTVRDNGPAANRVNIVFLGDGYTAAQINTDYPQHIDAMLNHMFNEGQDPFPRYASFFNAYRINVVSNESGADVPPLGIFRDTALDSKYYYDGNTERLLAPSSAKAAQALSTGLSGAGFAADIPLVTVNDTRYGGSGGTYPTFAGGNGSATEIALHEIGHQFAGLADHYGGNPGPYTGSEPSEPDVTKSATGQKWSQWLGYDQPGIGVIGAYEGGRYYDAGIYRPSLNSKMRSLGQPFDAVAREQFILEIYDRVDPLDAWLGNGGTLNNPASLWVDTIDSSVIDTEWFVNGNLVAGATGDSFRLQDYGYGAGTYTVRAHAFDPTDWVRLSRTSLEQSVTWQISITQILGDLNDDGYVNVFDVNVVSEHWGETGSLGDANGDKLVDVFDINFLSANWTGGGSAAVPEPASWLAMLLAAPLALAIAWRQFRPRRAR